MSVKTNKHEIWDMMLEGCNAIQITDTLWSGFVPFEIFRQEVERLIAAGLPPEYENDPRHIYELRAFWIFLEDWINPLTGHKDAFIVVFTPCDTYYLSDIVRDKISTDFHSTSENGKLDLSITESLRIRYAIKYVHEECYLAWMVDEKGDVTRYDGRYNPDTIAKKLEERSNGK